MRSFTARFIWILIILGAASSLAYLWAQASVSDLNPQADQGSPASPESFVPYFNFHEYTRGITLEEARAKASFEIPVPTHLPENVFLTDVRKNNYRDVFYLVYSDDERNTFLHDLFGPYAPKFIITITPYYGEMPDNERVEHMASPLGISEYIKTETGDLELVKKSIIDKHTSTVEIKGVEVKGFGRDLGYFDRTDGHPLYSFVEWWKNGLWFSIESGTYSLDELVKIAGSMMTTRSGEKFTKEITPTADAHVAEGYPNMNWGDATALYLQSYTENYKNERIFLKFDLSGTPANSKIVKVDLYLHRWRGKFADVDVGCYSIDDSWGEGTLTWNNQPTIKDTLGEVRLRRGGPEWYSWDVTSFVLSELERDKVASFCLKALTEGESGHHAFSSKEWRGGTLSPYLKVIYYSA